MGKQNSKAEDLRSWLVKVMTSEQRPNFDHIITSWRKWRYEVSR